MSDEPKTDDVKTETTPDPKPVGPPMLMGGDMRVEVVCEPKKEGSPFPPITATVVPFTRSEERVYLDSLKDKKGKEYEDIQNKELAKRIKSWDVHVVPGTVAEINVGTVERLPQFAVDGIELALYGEAGVLLGN